MKDNKQRFSDLLKRSLTDKSKESTLDVFAGEIAAAHAEAGGKIPTQDLLNIYQEVLLDGIGEIAKAETVDNANKINNKMAIIYKEALKLSLDLGLESSLDATLGSAIAIQDEILREKGGGKSPVNKSLNDIKTVVNKWKPGSNELQALKADVAKNRAPAANLATPVLSSAAATPPGRQPQQAQQPVRQQVAASTAPSNTPQPATQKQVAANIVATQSQPQPAAAPQAQQPQQMANRVPDPPSGPSTPTAPLAAATPLTTNVQQSPQPTALQGAASPATPQVQWPATNIATPVTASQGVSTPPGQQPPQPQQAAAPAQGVSTPVIPPGQQPPQPQPAAAPQVPQPQQAADRMPDPPSGPSTPTASLAAATPPMTNVQPLQPQQADVPAQGSSTPATPQKQQPDAPPLASSTPVDNQAQQTFQQQGAANATVDTTKQNAVPQAQPQPQPLQSDVTVRVSSPSVVVKEPQQAASPPVQQPPQPQQPNEPNAAPPAPRLSVVGGRTDFLKSEEYTKALPQVRESQCESALAAGLRAIAQAKDEGRALQINNDLKVVFAEYDKIGKEEIQKSEFEINSNVGRILRNATRGQLQPQELGANLEPKPDWHRDILNQWDPNLGEKGLNSLRNNLKKEAEDARALARHDAALGELGNINPQGDFKAQFAQLALETQNELLIYVKNDKSGIDIAKVSEKLTEYAEKDQADQFKKLYNVCSPEIKAQLLDNKELQQVLGNNVTAKNTKVYGYLKEQGANLSGANKVVEDKAAADKEAAEKVAAFKAAVKAANDKAAAEKTLTDKVTAQVMAVRPPDKGGILEENIVPVKPTQEPLNSEIKKPLESPVEAAKPAVQRPEEPPPAKRGSAVDDLRKTSVGFLKFGAAFGAAAVLCFVIPGAQVAVPFLLAAAALTTAVGVTGVTLWGLTKLVDALIVKPIKWVADKIRTPAQEKIEIEKEPLLHADKVVEKENEKSAANNNKGYEKLPGVNEAAEVLQKENVKIGKEGDTTVQKTPTPGQATVGPDTTVNTTKINAAGAQR